MHAWAAGETLTEVLEDDEDLTGGDFVRHVKQVIDLLHQIGDVAPNRRDRRSRPAPRPAPASAASSRPPASSAHDLAPDRADAVEDR